MGKLIFLSLLIISFGVHAKIPGSVWIGTYATLSRDGKLLCSTETSKNPLYVHGAGYADIHEGGNGWIWPLFADGCANHLAKRLQLQVKGAHLMDSLGQKVGKISNNELSTGSFQSEDVIVESFNFQVKESDITKVHIIFKRLTDNRLIDFSATYTLYVKH